MTLKQNIFLQKTIVTRELRNQQNGHKSVVIWFTGLSGSGKSTIAHLVEKHLYQLCLRTFVLDGDNVRHGLCSDLGFGNDDREENIRRIGEVAKLMLESGTITLTALISPFRKGRELVRNLLPHGEFIEVFCKASLLTCEKRDAKGLYKRARAGEIRNYTGIDSHYEEPLNPELIIDTEKLSIEESVKLVIKLLVEKQITNKDN